MDKFLITGANGFIGSHLVQQIQLQGFQVRAFFITILGIARVGLNL